MLVITVPSGVPRLAAAVKERPRASPGGTVPLRMTAPLITVPPEIQWRLGSSVSETTTGAWTWRSVLVMRMVYWMGRFGLAVVRSTCLEKIR